MQESDWKQRKPNELSK